MLNPCVSNSRLFLLDLGAGKTTLARGFVLCRLGVDGVDHETWVPRVTSPTYLLSNTYRFRDVDSGRDCE